MTSMAFIFGMFPLVIATGAGAASRQSLAQACWEECWRPPFSRFFSFRCFMC